MKRPKIILEIRKNALFLIGDQEAYYLQVFQRRQQFLAVDLSLTFLNTGTTDETFQQPGKQDSFRH